MNAVDTNVLVYRLDHRDEVKRAKACALLQRLAAGEAAPVLLWQVLAELIGQLRRWERKGEISRKALLQYIGVFRRIFTLTLPSAAVIDVALDLSGRYSLSHWDSMLLGACTQAGVTTLYTEDMGAPVSYDGIQLVNPFA